jgi:hypothetical protein
MKDSFVTSVLVLYAIKIFPKARQHTFGVFIKDILHIQDLKVNGVSGVVTQSCMSVVLCVMTVAK